MTLVYFNTFQYSFYNTSLVTFRTHLVCQTECSRQQPEKFACHVQTFLSTVTHLPLIASIVFLLQKVISDGKL